jgi:rare lipoprotein A
MLNIAADLPTKFYKASYYSNKFHGRKTASGERYNKDSLTCASNVHEFGTNLKVTNLNNDSVVIVKVNDRIASKYKHTRIDLSLAAMKQLKGIKSGVIPIKIEQL